jgi:Winged helix-turn helix
MTRFAVCICILILALGFAPFAFTQNGTATLTGTVRGQTGGVFLGAEITLLNANTGAAKETTTNSTGLYLLVDLVPRVVHQIELFIFGEPSDTINRPTMRVAPTIELSSAARLELEKLSRRIVLLAAEGMQNKEIAERIVVALRIVALWRSRFIQLGVEGLLKDAPRSGRTAEISPNIVGQVGCQHDAVQACRSHALVAQQHGACDGDFRVQRGRIWRAHGLKPHRIESFKVSNDPHFAQKLGSHRRPVSQSPRARRWLAVKSESRSF